MRIGHRLTLLLLISIVLVGCSQQDTKTYTTLIAGDGIILDPNPLILSGKISSERKYVLASYFQQNVRQQDLDLLGSFDSISTGLTLNAATPQTVTVGQGKVLLSLNAGADAVGTILISGTIVDRNNQSTSTFIDTLTIDGLTTRSGVVNLNGYLTSQWFKGDINVSTTDVSISDLDVSLIAFSQMNDVDSFTLKTLDMTFSVTNNNANMNTTMYLVEVMGDKTNITQFVSFGLPSSEATANRYYRFKESMDRKLNGRTEGVFIIGQFLPVNQNYFVDVNMLLWIKEP